MSNQLNDKLAQYDILYIQKVKYFLERPINQLYRELVKYNRDYYEPNQRIVLIDSVPNVDTKPFYNYLNRILKHLDIDECFVHIEQQGNETVIDPTNFNIPDTICASPWMNLEIRNQGNMSPCCLYGEKKQYGTKYKQTNIPNVESTSVRNVDFSTLRQEFLEGKLPDGCDLCWQNEKNGIKSKRINDQYSFRDKIFDIDYNDIYTNNLSSMDIKLSRTCNLACRICGPSISSKWTSEVFANREAYPQYDDLVLRKKEWTDVSGSKVWKDLEYITTDLKYLQFAGGEPLLDKTHGSMLQYFIDKQKSREITIHYNTNATQYATHLLPLWEQFKEVQLIFSIDNVGDKFEYERYGESWDKVIDTVTKYKNITETNLTLNVFSTISTLNILDMYELYKFCKQYELPLSVNPILYPKQLNFCLFNKTQKKYITDKLLQYNEINFLKLIEPILSLMNNTKVTTDITDMIDFLSITDKIRNQDYKQTYKELTNIL